MAEIIRNKYLNFIEVKKGMSETYAIRKHSHEELSIGFIENDSSTISCKTLRFNMNTDQAIFIPPHCIHLCQPADHKKFKFSMIYIDKNWIFEEFNLDVQIIQPQVVYLNHNEIKMKESYLSSFIEFDDFFQAESETITFVGNLIFNIFKIKPKTLHKSKNHKNISDVKNYIDSNYNSQIKLDDLVFIYGKNKFSLLRKFNDVYKLTPHAYLINKRINHAKKLLMQGKSIAHTAAECAFFDQSHFIKVFRQYVGMNPREYKPL